MTKFRIYGCVQDPDSYHCESLARKIAADDQSVTVDFQVMLEIDFVVKVDEVRKEFKNSGMLARYGHLNLVIRDDMIIGDLKKFIKVVEKEYTMIEHPEIQNSITINRSVREGSSKMVVESGKEVIFLEFGDASMSNPAESLTLGRVYIELFTDYCPKACENFLNLCTGKGPRNLTYTNKPVHRIVKDGWIQCGDVVDGTGKNSIAALDSADTVPDESFFVDFGFFPGGIVGFANTGAHTNGSQFFITLGPCEWMNNKFVGIGRVVQGFSTLRNFNKVPCDNQCPRRDIVIEDCGIAIDNGVLI